MSAAFKFWFMMIQIDRVLGLNPNLSCLRIGARGNLQPCNQSIEALVGFPSVFNDNPIAISCHIPIYVYSIYSDIPYDSDISCFNPTSATFIYVYPIFPRSQSLADLDHSGGSDETQRLDSWSGAGSDLGKSLFEG